MSSSPSKRRKTSSTTSVAVAVDFSEPRAESTPRRPSYQSPTKASLSRSHPTIFARSPGRRTSEGRGKELRQEILHGKASARAAGSENQSSIPMPKAALQNDDPGGAQTIAPEGVARSKAAGRPQQNRARRSPLRPRQPSASTRGQVTVEEPELPPTPTELGISPKPDPPRGLTASSSPSSCGSRRKRFRDKHGSPLKRPSERLREDTHLKTPLEAPESDVEHLQTDPNKQLEIHDPIVREQYHIRDELTAQLARLKSELAQLENGLEDSERDVDLNLLDLLRTPNFSCDSNFTEIDAHPAFGSLKEPTALDVNPLAFLRAFSPGDLRLTTITKSMSPHGRLHQVHILNISAPPPWPPHVFNATFRVTCDVERHRVTSITGFKIRPRQGAGIKELRHWVEARLKNPLHELDAGTFVWGFGMWWKEAVSRAKFFHHVDVTKASKGTGQDHTPYRSTETVKADEVQSLLPYIGKSFVELIPAEPYSNRASTNEARKYRQPRLLLKWDLDLDWAGEVHVDIDVAGTKVSTQGQEWVKKSFKELKRRKGLDEAVRLVLQLCRGGTRKKRR